MGVKPFCKYKPDGLGGYDTKCKEYFSMTDTVENWTFCPGCGRPIKLPKSERVHHSILGDESLDMEDYAVFGAD